VEGSPFWSMKYALGRRPRRNARARYDPLIVGAELQSERIVVNSEVAVPSTQDGLGDDLLHLLRNHANIGAVASFVTKSVKSKTVVQIPEKHDVVLERNVRSPSSTAVPARSTRASRARSPR
jgi:hypothetical protein